MSNEIPPEHEQSVTAIATHVWIIANYIRDISDDPARQGELAANVSATVVVALEELAKAEKPGT